MTRGAPPVLSDEFMKDEPSVLRFAGRFYRREAQMTRLTGPGTYRLIAVAVVIIAAGGWYIAHLWGMG